jgi:hypothetical protein
MDADNNIDNTTETNDKNVSALEHNIKTKKENSYYYAHAYKFDNKSATEQAKTISGPGIITGGDPVLLQKVVKPVEVLKEPKKFTKYIFYDDEKNVVVKIDLPEECKEVTEECLNVNFGERSLDLRVNVPNSDPYFYTVKKLFQKIVTDQSSIKIVKGKIVITLRKTNEDEEWSKLSA